MHIPGEGQEWVEHERDLRAANKLLEEIMTGELSEKDDFGGYRTNRTLTQRDIELLNNFYDPAGIQELMTTALSHNIRIPQTETELPS
jgi:hypothetical protein